MNELKSEKVPPVKEQSLDHSSYIQLAPQINYPQHDPASQGVYVDLTSLLKIPYENQMAYNYGWTNNTCFHDNHLPFYPYAPPFYGNQNYAINPYSHYPNKLYETHLPLAPTNSSVDANPYMQRMPYLPYHQIPPNLPVVQPNQNREFWVQENVEVEESLPEPELKVEYNSSLQRELGLKRLKSKMKNETKNIPKNYGKAMISFILSHLDWIQSEFGIERRQELVSELKKRKNSINAIVHLKDLWTSSKYAKEFRILSNLFLRKYSFAYIFNSRVSNYSTHIKYKYKLQEALRSPGNFSRIKEY